DVARTHRPVPDDVDADILGNGGHDVDLNGAFPCHRLGRFFTLAVEEAKRQIACNQNGNAGNDATDHLARDSPTFFHRASLPVSAPFSSAFPLMTSSEVFKTVKIRLLTSSHWRA